MQVYISHARADAKLADRIAAVLRDAGLQVWDDSQILAGDNWAEKLAEGLAGSNAIVVLVTTDYANSANLGYEVGYALGNRDFKGRLIPVIVERPGESMPIETPWVFSKLRTIHLKDPDTDDAGLQQIAQALKAAA